MPSALILSSYVAASRVGGMAQVLALAPFGIEPVLVPTVLFGRHPGWGPPGGAAVDAETFGEVLEGVGRHGVLASTDLILTGYFASAEQVRVAAQAIDAARKAARPPGKTPAWIVVDPVMGDADKGLYVREAVAEAVSAELVGQADIVTPNLWELERLTGQTAPDARAAVTAARSLGRPCLVTSVPAGAGEIGVLYVDAASAILAAHRRLEGVPRGTGDLISALFGAHLIKGRSPADALALAVGGVAEAAEAAVERGAPELMLADLADRLVRPTAAVRIEILS